MAMHTSLVYTTPISFFKMEWALKQYNSGSVHGHDHSIFCSRKGEVVIMIIPISTSPPVYLSCLIKLEKS